MSFFAEHLLTTIVAVPIVGALLALAFPRDEHSGVRGFALAVSFLGLGLTCWLWARFDIADPGMQMRESLAWVPQFGIRYMLGIDGVALVLVALTQGLLPLVVLNAYSSISTRPREYVFCLLLLQAGMLGAFLATDLFLFYVFWELMLIPMYFLIGMWGGKRRVYAALKFFLYTMAGSVLMLVAILYTVWAVRDQGGLTFDWAEIGRRLPQAPLGDAERWLFLAFALAFAIKVPLFPFHTWLPDAHVQAPTGGSVVLAGVLLKLGTFGFLRYAFWLFPRAAAEFLPALGLLAVIGIVYGALVAMVQTDLKRLVAYSSVSHLGFVLLGLCALTVTGVTGGVLQMVNHGVSTAALFLLVGVIYERRHTRKISDMGGLAQVMPMYAAVWVLIALSSIGVPGLNGFVGEFMILVGSFTSQGIGVAVATGNIAWAGIVALAVIASLAVVFVALRLMRLQSPEVGPRTKVAALGVVALVALMLACPPFGGFGGGLLVQPLVPWTDRKEAFREVFALFSVIAASGVIFAAVYLLWATQRVFFGPIRHKENAHLSDLSLREGFVLGPLVLAAVLLGLFPKPVLEVIEPSAQAYAAHVRARAGLPGFAVVDAGAPEAAPEQRDADKAMPQRLRQDVVPLPRQFQLPIRERLERLQRMQPEAP